MAFHRHKLNNSNFRCEASYSDERLQTYCLYDNSFTSRPGKVLVNGVEFTLSSSMTYSTCCKNTVSVSRGMLF